MPKKNTDEVLNNSDLPETPQDPILERLNRLEEDNARLREQQTLLQDRNLRLEYAVGDQKKMRQWDEINDPLHKKKLGHVPSMDRKIPIINIENGPGTSWLDAFGINHDEQTRKLLPLEGEPVVVDLNKWNALCSGKSIKAVCENFDEVMEAKRRIDEKRTILQRVRVKNLGGNVDVKTMLAEIEEMEKNIKYRVTLSEDQGLTYKGQTIEIPEICWNCLA